jgi:nucleoside-diphosphate-sugar epimerase
MSPSLVLVTGGTGHVGFKVIVDALAAGYSVRAAIRDSSKENSILSATSIKSLNPDSRLSFVTVPDITIDGAYDAAAKGVKYIIHVASTFPTPTITEEEYESVIITPAVAGTVGILKSALKTTGVERVIVTGSIASIIPISAVLGGSEEVFDETSNTPPPPPPMSHRFMAYFASKAGAYKSTKDFIESEKPAFDVISSCLVT